MTPILTPQTLRRDKESGQRQYNTICYLTQSMPYAHIVFKKSSCISITFDEFLSFTYLGRYIVQGSLVVEFSLRLNSLPSSREVDLL